MVLKVKRIHRDAKIPSYANPGDAGMDIYAAEVVTVKPGESSKIKTGISVEIPDGYVGLCWDKSGLSMNHGIKVLAGVIDSGFRGELVLAVHNLGKEEYTFQIGDKVMQMLLQPVLHCAIEVTDSLSSSERGENGFGSSGK